MRRHIVLVVTAVVFIAAFTGCGGDDAKPSPTPAATLTAPAATPTIGRVANKTGIPSVDAAIAAELAADGAALQSLIRYQPIACTLTITGIGAPPRCRPGEADGTPVDVLSVATCEPEYQRRDEFRAEGITTPGATLYAVYRSPDLEFPSGDYFVMFLRPENPQATPRETSFSLIMTADGITGIFYGCDATAPQTVTSLHLTDPIIAPR